MNTIKVYYLNNSDFSWVGSPGSGFGPSDEEIIQNPDTVLYKNIKNFVFDFNNGVISDEGFVAVVYKEEKA